MLYWLSSYCIVTIMIIVYKMMALLMAYCTCTALLFFFVFCLYPYCICGQFIFFTWAASQWAVWLLWQPSDCMAIFVIYAVLLSENKYDDVLPHSRQSTN